jgi:hypothetical protein
MPGYRNSVLVVLEAEILKEDRYEWSKKCEENGERQSVKDQMI